MQEQALRFSGSVAWLGRMARKNSNGLTGQQQRFVDEYLADPEQNAKAAYMKAYPKTKGNAAEASASRLLRHAKVVEVVVNAMKVRSEKAGVDALWVLLQAAKQYKKADEADNIPAAIKALEVCGKHVDVQAFRDVVDVHHHDHASRIERIRKKIAEENERPTTH